MQGLFLRSALALAVLVLASGCTSDRNPLVPTGSRADLERIPQDAAAFMALAGDLKPGTDQHRQRNLEDYRDGPWDRTPAGKLHTGRVCLGEQP